MRVDRLYLSAAARYTHTQHATFSHACACAYARERGGRALSSNARLARTGGGGYTALERVRKRDCVSRAVHRRHPWHAPTLTMDTAICTLSHRKIKVDGQHCRRRHHRASPRAAPPRDRYSSILAGTSPVLTPLPLSRMYSHAHVRVKVYTSLYEIGDTSPGTFLPDKRVTGVNSLERISIIDG